MNKMKTMLKMRTSNMGGHSRGIAAIVGAGPKLGRSIAKKFAHEGYTVAILSRDLGRLSQLADDIAREEIGPVFAIRIDCSNAKSVRDAFEGVLSLGPVEVLVYNAHEFAPTSLTPTPRFTDISLEAFHKSIAVSSVGAFHCAQQVLPGMVERGKGTILFSGCSASLRGLAGLPDLCCGKFALRALSQCLAKEFNPFGVHVAHVIIDGIVGPPRGPSKTVRGLVGEQLQNRGIEDVEAMAMVTMDPDAVAQTYWHLHVQDRSAWTQEINISPANYF